MRTKILSPLRRDGIKAGMMIIVMALSAMLLTTACSSEDDLVNNTAENTEAVANKGYALPVTVNVTRQGDGTRATFDGSKLNFGAGDKLFVEGKYATGSKSFAGALDYVSEGTFSGTIYAQDNTYSTYDALLTAASSVTATLLPNYYESTGFLSINNNSTTDIAYDDRLTRSFSNAFVASETAKATGVEQLSWEQATVYDNGFALAPGNAILNFTISGLAAGAQNVSLQIQDGFDYDVTGSVTPNASGVATFAVGAPVGANIKEGSNNLTVGSSNFTLPSSTTFAAGKIYNITRSAIPTGAISGQFTVRMVGINPRKVYFSKGNLQLTGENAWQFANNQWEYFGNSQSDNHRDLFGWGTGNNPNQTSTSSGDYGTFTDWGSNSDLQTALGSGWRTLTKDEWVYLFTTRTVNGGKGNGKSYTYGQSVNGILGVVLYPDNYTGSTYTTGSDWSTFEAAGCVFLPAAGGRYGTSVGVVGSDGNYWSSTADGTVNAYYVYSNSGSVSSANSIARFRGYSVRLVRDAN
jgi:hypothetical protein